MTAINSSCRMPHDANVDASGACTAPSAGQRSRSNVRLERTAAGGVYVVRASWGIVILLGFVMLLVPTASLSQTASANEERGPITFATGNDASGTLRRVIEKWNSRRPGEKVTMLELSTSADEQRVAMAQNFQAASSRYDVLNADVAWTAEFAARNWLEPLDQKRFAGPAVLPAPADSGRFDGTLFGAPYATSAGMLFYRSDLIKTPPKTWAELTYLCQTVAKQNGMDCYAGQYAQYEGLTVNIAEAIASAGGSFIGEDGKRVTVDSAQARDGLRFLVDGFHRGWIPRRAITYKEEDGRRDFQQGHLLFLRNWPYVYALANKAGPDSVIAGKFDVAPVPGINGLGRSIVGGKNLMLSRFSKHKASALDWMEFMQSEEAQIEMQAPVLAKMYDDPGLRQRLPFIPALKRIMLQAAIRPATPNYHAVTLVIQKNTYAALQGRKSIDQAIVDMASELKQAVSRGY
jgi:multiple sugar transport system substrate-binding protein